VRATLATGTSSVVDLVWTSEIGIFRSCLDKESALRTFPLAGSAARMRVRGGAEVESRM